MSTTIRAASPTKATSGVLYTYTLSMHMVFQSWLKQVQHPMSKIKITSNLFWRRILMKIMDIFFLSQCFVTILFDVISGFKMEIALIN